MAFDVVVRGGQVFDGLGGPPHRLDVGITGDRIVALDDLGTAQGTLEVDASGLAVAPGFIDTHTHSDVACFLGPAHAVVASASARQGVTTEVSGNCGFSVFPRFGARGSELVRLTGMLFGPTALPWTDLDGYWEAVRQAGIVANRATLVGHGSLRATVMGLDDRAPGEEEMKTMARLLEQAFDQGAVGFSSGLVYAPGTYARTEELISLCRSVARFGRPYCTHMRGESEMVVDSVREAIRTGQESGVPLHISHHKVAGRANWGRTAETLPLIEDARGRGLDVTLDVYPYTAGSTILAAILPPWVQEGGVDVMLERLRERAVRARISRELSEGLTGWENKRQAAGWDGIVIAWNPASPRTEGRSIAELARSTDKDPADCAFDLLLEARGQVLIILHMMAEADVQRVLAYPHAMVGSDGIPVPGKPHPRWAGSFARVLGRYVREQRVLELPEAIRKMTAAAAARFGLRDRGVIAPGKQADLVVFDPATIIDRATYEEPLLPPAGVPEVIVNGVSVVRGAQLTGAKPGIVLSGERLS
jgi:dihydroorotase/N-acyl-D-amino-acid deacylase